MIQRPYFVLILALVAHTYTIHTCILLFIYLYYTYFILAYYTSLLYYTFIKNIYDPTSYFTLTLFLSYYLHDSEIFKYHAFSLSIETNRSRVYRVQCASASTSCVLEIIVCRECCLIIRTRIS